MINFLTIVILLLVNFILKQSSNLFEPFVRLLYDKHFQSTSGRSGRKENVLITSSSFLFRKKLRSFLYKLIFQNSLDGFWVSIRIS